MRASKVLRMERFLSDAKRLKYRSGESLSQETMENKQNAEYFRVLVGPDEEAEDEWERSAGPVSRFDFVCFCAV